jgi:hypothetical protein
VRHCSSPPPPSHTHTLALPRSRFAWGRSRVPLVAKWPTPHTLTQSTASSKHCPVGHTCFFSVDLPVYTSREQLKAKLELAVTQCATFEMG